MAMTLLICWLVFPIVLGLLCLGCGLLLERAAGIRLPGVLLVPVGFAVIVIAAQIATSSDATAELATPLVVALAAAGFVLGAWRGRTVDGWALGAALAVFAVFAAPVVLTGEATFTGYIKLDDTSIWFELVDRVMEHGRNLEGLPPSTYEASLDFNLASGYPVGTFLPLGVGRELVGQDVAWVFQPYEAFLALLLTLSLYRLAEGLIESRPLRAVAVFVAAQSALLFGYALWGGVKEMAAAWIVALIAALLFLVLRDLGRWRPVLPLAAALSAAIALMSPAGALAWGLPLLLPAFVATFGMRRGQGGARTWIALIVATAALTLPWLPAAGFVPPTAKPLTSDIGLGTLGDPLNPLQIAGIWPTGDFRSPPDLEPVTYGLIGLVIAGALLGVYLGYRRRAWSLILYTVGTIFAAVAILVIASPWVGAKALAIASPASLLAAMAAAAFLVGRTRVPLAGLAMLALAGGVLASNVLAYREANIAPRDRLAELARIGEMLDGKGLTLVPENEPYATHHFLRQGDVTGVSAYRRHTLPLREGGTVPRGSSADLDELVLETEEEGVLVFRTIVTRRSPLASRPPAPYRLIWSGRYYEVWTRPVGAEDTVLGHLPLGDQVNPAARAPCGGVLSLARLAKPEGRLVAAARGRTPLVRPLGVFEHGLGRAATSTDTAELEVRVARGGAYEIWLRGRTRGRIDLSIDGREAGSIEHELGTSSQYMFLGEVNLTSGPHAVRVRAEHGGLYPGSYGQAAMLGPLVLRPADSRVRLVSVRPDAAGALCGREFDWVEAIGPA
jgi:hypothetical protein